MSGSTMWCIQMEALSIQNKPPLFGILLKWIGNDWNEKVKNYSENQQKNFNLVCSFIFGNFIGVIFFGFGSLAHET